MECRQCLFAQVNDIRENIRQEVVIVRHEADGGVRERLEVVGEPRDGACPSGSWARPTREPAFQSMARAMASFIRQPPESD